MVRSTFTEAGPGKVLQGLILEKLIRLFQQRSELVCIKLMRIWSLHPQYLDAKGLVALWRETLLAKHVLENKTRGYKISSAAERFKKTKRPVDSINHYLFFVLQEAHIERL